MSQENIEEILRRLLATDKTHTSHLLLLSGDLVGGGSALAEITPEAHALYEQFERIMRNEDRTMNNFTEAGFQAIDAESALSKAIHASNPEDINDKTAALKSLRITINLAISGAKDIADILIKRGPGGRELSLAITNLQQARMWAGEALGEIGHKLPEEYRDEVPHV